MQDAKHLVVLPTGGDGAGVAPAAQQNVSNGDTSADPGVNDTTFVFADGHVIAIEQVGGR